MSKTIRLYCVKSVRIRVTLVQIRKNMDQNNSENGLFSRSVTCDLTLIISVNANSDTFNPIRSCENKMLMSAELNECVT